MIWKTLMAIGLLTASVRGDSIQRIGVDPVSGMSELMVVPDSPTWHASRIVASADATGKRPTDLTGQTNSILQTLAAQLSSLGSDSHRVIRLNVGLVDPQGAEVVRSVLADHFAEDQRPVVTFVGSQMPESDVLIAVDAVGIVETATTVPENFREAGAVCLPGPKVYISGKAANGDLATATRDTLKQINDNLTSLNLAKSDIVQLRAFVSNVSEIEAFHREVRAYFGEIPLPAIAFTQWISSGYPIEIEAVVKDTSGGPVSEMEFITPPGETASPVFCRVVRVPAGPLIYTTGLTGGEGTDSAAQVTRIFERLKPLLEQSGSDLQHLAKATYFCADDASSNSLNAIRPSLYDPARPPAASKAIVPHTGLTGRAVVLDWIAVPKR